MLLKLLLSFYLNASEPQVVVAALAKVGDQVITSRDLQIHLFLNESFNPLAEFVDRREPLKDITAEHLIVREAQTLVAVQVSPSDVTSLEEKVLKKLRSDSLWISMNVSPKELQEQLRRKIMVQQILNLKMPKDLLTVNEEAVEAYYMQNKTQLGQRPLADVRDKIFLILKKQKNQERFRDWMAAVLRTHEVVYYSGYKIQ